MRFPIAATLACLVLAPPIALLVVILAPTYSSWPLTAALAAAAVCGSLGVRREGQPANELRAGALRGMIVVTGGLLLTLCPSERSACSRPRGGGCPSPRSPACSPRVSRSPAVRSAPCSRVSASRS